MASFLVRISIKGKISAAIIRTAHDIEEYQDHSFGEKEHVKNIK